MGFKLDMPTFLVFHPFGRRKSKGSGTHVLLNGLRFPVGVIRATRWKGPRLLESVGQNKLSS